jgi:hypothetical protein
MKPRTNGKPRAGPKRQNLKPDDPEQSKRFVEAAREIEADESGEAFRRALEKIVPPAHRDVAISDIISFTRYIAENAFPLS